MLSNPVVISIVVLLALSLLRVNVVIALVISALTAGLCGDLGLSKTIETFTGGLGGGAEVAMNYAVHFPLRFQNLASLICLPTKLLPE